MTEETILPTREAILARYRPIRTSIQTALAAAVKHCRKPETDRAAKHLDLVDREQLKDEETAAMLFDVALFEPNQRGRRAFDSFLDKRIGTLDAASQDVARRLGTAFFSIFRVAGRHEIAGVWLEDMLAPNQRLWLLDESLEISASEGLVIAMRVFDSGPFHAGFGIVVQPDAEAVAFCTSAAARGEPLPVRHSLAAALYGDDIARSAVSDAIESGLAQGMLDAMMTELLTQLPAQTPGKRPPPAPMRLSEARTRRPRRRTT